MPCTVAILELIRLDFTLLRCVRCEDSKVNFRCCTIALSQWKRTNRHKLAVGGANAGVSAMLSQHFINSSSTFISPAQ